MVFVTYRIRLQNNFVHVRLSIQVAIFHYRVGQYGSTIHGAIHVQCMRQTHHRRVCVPLKIHETYLSGKYCAYQSRVGSSSDLMLATTCQYSKEKAPNRKDATGIKIILLTTWIMSINVFMVGFLLVNRLNSPGQCYGRIYPSR